MESIADYENANPAVDGAFNNSCNSGCTVVTCSYTASFFYWSSTTNALNTAYAWDVFFHIGVGGSDLKFVNYNVRAVRGGCVD